MAFYAGRLILHPAMENPTIVVLTDRNDLDDQLFGTFARCHDLLRQAPVQAESRADLRAKLLQVASGGVVFTTIQKFLPEEKGDRHPVLSERRNIVVIADEAHRSQYDFIDGFARHLRDALPNASFIGFTGTPIEKTDANTRAVFGDYISIYDIQRAVDDGATVPIYYESRLAKLELKEAERPKIDPEFEEVTEGEEVERKEKLKTKWAQLEALVGSENRVKLIARDLVEHFENAARGDGRQGDDRLHEPAHLRRPLRRAGRSCARNGTHDDDDKGALKVVMTGSAADPLDWQPHIRNKTRREALAKRFRTPSDPFQHRDRARHVADRLRRAVPAHDVRRQADARPRADAGHRPRQPRLQGQARRARRRLPRPRRRAEAGARDLHRERRHRARRRSTRHEAVAVMLEKYEICCGLFHGFDWTAWTTARAQERLSLLPRGAGAHPRAGGRQGAAAAGRDRAVAGLRAGRAARGGARASATTSASSRRCARCWPRARRGERKTDEELDHAIRQIVSKARRRPTRSSTSSPRPG